MGKIFFISGIDTGVGKTIATGVMARSLRKRNVNAITVKLVQTGNDGRSEDLELHRELMGGVSFPEDRDLLTAPQIFHFPSSPLLSARLEGKQVDTQKIVDSVNLLAARYEVVLAEGAGGLAVPLTDELLTADLAAREQWPLILVTSGKLGSLNHTILSIDYACARGMRIAGVVYNYCAGADSVIDADTADMVVKYLRKKGQSDALVRVPQVDVKQVPDVDFSRIFGSKA